MSPAGSSRLPELGRRGGGWVAGQVVLMAAVFLAPLAVHGGFALPTAAAGAVVLAVGVLLIVAAGRRLGPSLTPYPRPRARAELTTTGAYALVRHPIYGAAILIALGWSILFATWLGLVLTLVLAAFFDLKSRREEAWLVERLPGYEQYRRTVRRRLLPFVY